MSKDEVYRLKQERDRILSISSELRAELNKARSKVNHFKAMLEQEGLYDSSGRAKPQQTILEDSQESMESSRQEKSREAQQTQLSNLSHIVGELAEQMRDWMQQSKGEAMKKRATANSKVKMNNYTGAKGTDTLADKRSRSRGRLYRGQSKETLTAKSLSPDSKMRKKGEEFLSKINEIKQDLEVQGESLSLLQQDMQPEGIPK